MVGALSRRPVENYVGILMLKFSSNRKSAA